MQENLKAGLAIPESLLLAHGTALHMEMQPDRLDVAAALVGAVFCLAVHRFFAFLSLRLRFRAAIFALDLLFPPLRPLWLLSAWMAAATATSSDSSRTGMVL